MVLGNNSTGGEFESTLKEHARKLVGCLEQGHFQQAMQLIQELSQARDHGLYRKVGGLTRELHDAIAGFQIDLHSPHAQEMPQIVDAIDHLSCVVEMVEEAANQIIDLVEQSAPLVNQLDDDSRELHQEWQCFMHREVGADGSRELAKHIEQFLVCSGENAGQLFSQLNGIPLAQDYQDLTGQVIKHVTKLVTGVESNFVKLV